MKEKGYTILEVLFVFIGLFGVIGWILNIATIAQSSLDPITGMIVIRIIGVFIAPLGAILGYV
jgi:lipopolysaccharide export LptBFGC system permease protein LptF